MILMITSVLMPLWGGLPELHSLQSTFTCIFMSSQHPCEGSVIVPILQMMTRMRTDTYRALVMGQVPRETLTLVLVTSLLSESEEDLQGQQDRTT